MTKKEQAIKTEYHFMSHTDSDYQTDRLEELKQKFMEEGDLLAALNELACGDKYAKEMCKLAKEWNQEAKNGFDLRKMVEIAIPVFAHINSSMEVSAEKWAVEAFKKEIEGDGDPGYDREDLNYYRQAA